MNCDCAFTWFLNEVTLEDGELVFNCTNGYVSIKAKEIKLGIPTQQADKLVFIKLNNVYKGCYFGSALFCLKLRQ